MLRKLLIAAAVSEYPPGSISKNFSDLSAHTLTLLVPAPYTGRPVIMRKVHTSNRLFAFGRTLLLGTFLSCSMDVSMVLAQTVGWDHLAEGLAIGLWNPPAECPGVPPLVVTDIDPNRYRFSVHYYRNELVKEPLDIREWQRKTGHLLVFNAGLFRENFSYLGLLYGQGKSLGGKRHSTWMGLFVAEPTVPDLKPAGILDLALDSFDDKQPPFGEVAQSLMLLDRTGHLRVAQSSKQSQQTIVAEQSDGHILLLKTTEIVTLYSIGQCLRDAYPKIRQAMVMDGGSSSNLSISPALQEVIGSTAGPHAWLSVLNAGSAGHIPLPAVIGISPR